MTVPTPDLMVTEPCCDAHPGCLDVLCAGCGWTGHCEPQDAPWPIFQAHRCVTE
jgi:hypothetical protein